MQSTTPSDGDSNVGVGASVTVNFSEPVTVTDGWYTIACSSSGAHTATVTGGPVGFTIDPDTNFANSESCTVTVVASHVTDQDTTDPPDAMAGDHSFSFTTAGAAPLVVISQVYGGGGNAGATLKNDFIELFNRGASPVSLNGWSVQYASAAGTGWTPTEPDRRRRSSRATTTWCRKRPVPAAASTCLLPTRAARSPWPQEPGRSRWSTHHQRPHAAAVPVERLDRRPRRLWRRQLLRRRRGGADTHEHHRRAACGRRLRRHRRQRRRLRRRVAEPAQHACSDPRLQRADRRRRQRRPSSLPPGDSTATSPSPSRPARVPPARGSPSAATSARSAARAGRRSSTTVRTAT